MKYRIVYRKNPHVVGCIDTHFEEPDDAAAVRHQEVDAEHMKCNGSQALFLRLERENNDGTYAAIKSS